MSRKITKEEFLQRIKEVYGKDLIPIGEFKGVSHKMLFYCVKHNYVFEAIPTNIFKKKQMCPDCHFEKKSKIRKKSQIQFIKELGVNNPDVLLLSGYTNMTNKHTWFVCKKDKRHIWQTTPDAILNGKQGCPYCSKRKFLEEDSVYYLRPDLRKYFINEEDAKNYSLYSNKRITLKCPDCGYEKIMPITTLTKQGFNCDNCNLSGISFPNRVMREVLKEFKQLKNITFEYNIKEEKNRFLYDGYFEFNDKKYLIEMDGGLHFKENKLSGLEYSKKRDESKNKLSEKYEYILIRIACPNATIEEIKEGFKKSILSNFLNFENIDWDTIEENATKNIIKQVCEFYNENKEMSLTDIGKHFDLSRVSIRNYLIKGNNIGWTSFNKNTAQNLYKNNHFTKVFLYTEDFEFIEEYESIVSCQNNTKIHMSTIKNRLDNFNPLNKQVKHRYYFSSHKLKDEEILLYKKESNKSYGNDDN